MNDEPPIDCQKNKAGTADDRVGSIRKLNDLFRRTLIGGRVVLTNGIVSLGNGGVASTMKLVRSFDNFGPGCDPYNERDFGSVLFAGQQIFWKIDYYDMSLEFGSPDPSDPAVTTRVMTVMLASEY